MKKGIRFVSVLLTMLLVLGTLTACGKTTDEPSSPGEAAGDSNTDEAAPSDSGASGDVVELNIVDSFLEDLTEPDVIALNIAIENFETAHPEIKLIRDQSSADVIDTKVPTLAAANELPDLFACRSAWVPNFVQSGQVMPLKDLFAGDTAFIDGFIPGMLGDFTYEGNIYGIPWRSMSMFIMYYNTEKLAEAGVTKVPETYEDLLAAIEACKAANIAPISLGDLGKWQSRMWLSGISIRTAGADWMDKLQSGQMKFTDPEMVKAIGIIGEVGTSGGFNADFTSIDFLQGRQLFYDGTTAMYAEMAAFAQSENEAWPEAMRNPETVVMGFFPTLEGEDTSKPVNMPIAADWGIAFNSNLTGAKLDAARLFATEVMGDDYNRILAEHAGIAVRPVEGELSDIPEAVQRYNNDIAPNMVTGGHIDSRMPGSVLDAVSAALQDMMLGVATPEQAAERMQAAWEESQS
ncbi:extracellular solute-binding protein [Lachnospiraceae bacterium ZAX-1]